MVKKVYMKNSWIKLLMTLYPPFVYAGIRSTIFIHDVWYIFRRTIFDQLLWSIYDLLIISSLLSDSFIRKTVFSRLEFILLRRLYGTIFILHTLSFQLIYFFVISSSWGRKEEKQKAQYNRLAGSK